MLHFLGNEIDNKHGTYNTHYIHYTLHTPKSLALELKKRFKK